MKTYETVIRIIGDGLDPDEAAEAAGEIINVAFMTGGMMVMGGKTHEIGVWGVGTEEAGGKRRYLTEFVIKNQADDSFEAGDKAGRIVDMTKLRSDMVITCSPTRESGRVNIPAREICEKIDHYSGRFSRNIFASCPLVL
jgi:hypothetical protein